MAYNTFTPIVTDSLILYLDAANTKSYTTSGSTSWFDLSSNRFTSTLTNGPIFNSSNLGSISLDGTNDYVEIITGGRHIPNLTACTVNCFVNFTNFTKLYNTILETFSTGDQNYQFAPLVKSTGKLAFYVFNTLGNQSSYDGTGTYTLLTNTWYMLTFVFQGSTIQRGYVNGLLDGSVVSPVSSIASSNQNARIGFSVLADRYPAMQIAQLQIYSKALSSTEILQNYNATKFRFQ